MKQFLIITTLLLLVGFSSLHAQEEKVLTGPITIAELLDLPEWFGEDYLTYKPARKYLDQIPPFLEDVEIVCVLGTWCSDSRREVPRLIRILQTENIPPEKLQMIAVDRDKRSPNGEASQYNVELVPTFIFIRNGKEIGRIVEAPLASIEKDMLGIINPDAGKGEPEMILLNSAGQGIKALDAVNQNSGEQGKGEDGGQSDGEGQQPDANIKK